MGLLGFAVKKDIDSPRALGGFSSRAERVVSRYPSTLLPCPAIMMLTTSLSGTATSSVLLRITKTRTYLIEESNSSPQIENQLLQPHPQPHPDDVSSYDIETMRRIIFDMMQDLGTGIDIDSIESSFSKITSHQPMSIPKSYPNHVSSAQHPSIETDLKLQVRPVSSCFSRRSSSIPLFIKCNGKDSSIMMEEANDDDDVLSAGHSSVADAVGCEVTSVDLQQMVNHIRSSAPRKYGAT